MIWVKTLFCCFLECLGCALCRDSHKIESAFEWLVAYGNPVAVACHLSAVNELTACADDFPCGAACGLVCHN